MTEFATKERTISLEQSSALMAGKAKMQPMHTKQKYPLSVLGTGCLNTDMEAVKIQTAGECFDPIHLEYTSERDRSLEQLVKNLNAIRGEGFSKLSRLVRDLHTEKHSYKQSIDEIDKQIDEHVFSLKLSIDKTHKELKDQLKRIKERTTKKISNEIEQCRKSVRTMNELVQNGITAIESKSNDYELMFELNLDILDKMNYMKSLKNSLHVTPPEFQFTPFSQRDVENLVGIIREGKGRDFKTENGFPADIMRNYNNIPEAQSKVDTSDVQHTFNDDVIDSLYEKVSGNSAFPRRNRILTYSRFRKTSQ